MKTWLLICALIGTAVAVAEPQNEMCLAPLAEIAGEAAPLPREEVFLRVPQIVRVTAEDAEGRERQCSGSVVGKDKILTAQHCIDKATSIQVYYDMSTEAELALVLRKGSSTAQTDDWAVLAANTYDFPPFEIVDTTQYVENSMVMVIGYPGAENNHLRSQAGYIVVAQLPITLPNGLYTFSGVARKGESGSPIFEEIVQDGSIDAAGPARGKIGAMLVGYKKTETTAYAIPAKYFKAAVAE